MLDSFGYQKQHKTYIQVHSEEIAKEESQILYELLIPRVAAWICALEIKRNGNDVSNGSQGLGEHLNKLLVVRVGLAGAASLKATNLSKALHGDVAELRRREETGSQCLDKRCLEDVSQGDPVAESQKGLEGRLDQTRLCGRVEDLLAEVEDLRELGAHGLLEVACLGRCHLLG